YSALTPRQKMAVVMIVSFVAMISPVAGNIYYPAISTLANEFDVSTSMIQLTITTYQIFQGVAPTVIANYSDIYGRRPAYAICLVAFLAANIGLALQTSYPALMVLRCLQSTGSSATVALGAGAVADMVTRAERGRFISYAALGVTLGPALAPIIGGLLVQNLGWRSIFWFLAIYAGVVFAIYFVFVPETARSVVGNGDVSPKSIFMTPSQYLELKRRRNRSNTAPPIADQATAAAAAAATTTTIITTTTTTKPRQRKTINPFAALKILGEREGAVTVGFGALIYGGYFMVLTTLPLQLTDRFHLNAAQTGLCYLPIFIGTICSRWTAGRLLDWNYRRHARRLGLGVSRDREQRQDELDLVPVEAARMQVCIPMIYVSAVCVVVYGWTVQARASLAGIEVALFFLGLFNSGGLVGLSTLVMDTHPDNPAAATAANNMFRYLVSAGATAVAVPLIERIGIGWTSVFIGGVWACFSPFLWLVMIYGAQWRLKKKAKME
ncbi:MFS general substrate transporter, partial [Colletotrichum zoysiae]